ncbi:predicted protein, partial [Nematostella vectensis]
IFERILYIWAIRHPASGYVQGMNDLVTPFFVVFLSAYADGDLENYDVQSLSQDILDTIEADSFWCMSKLLDGIQQMGPSRRHLGGVCLLACFTSFLMATTAILSQPSPICRFEKKQNANFDIVIKGKSLAGHVVSAHSVNLNADCALLCIGHRKCQSFNYQSEGGSKHRCELNSQSADASAPLQERTGFTYYGPSTSIPDACASSSCLHGGTCVRSCHDEDEYQCFCQPDNKGQQCQQWKADASLFDIEFGENETSSYTTIDVPVSFSNFSACFWLNTTTKRPQTIFSYSKQADVLMFSCDKGVCHVNINGEKG